MIKKYTACLVILFSMLMPCFSMAFETNAKYAILMDYDTSEILYDKNANSSMHPSSMTKLMTVYVVFEHLQKGILHLEDKFRVSEKSWRTGGSKMFLNHRDRVTVEQLLNGIIVQSGNDACIAMAEGISSSEEAFVELMNKTSQRIGLEGSVFKNTTGLPDEGHVMTAKDIAVLSANIIKNFPKYYEYFSKQEYSYGGIKQKNRNLLLYDEMNVDGLKTGHTDDGGYGIAVSAKQDGRRLIAVVNGLASEIERAEEARRLLIYGFRYFDNKTFYDAGDVVANADIWYGADENVPLVTKEKINLPVPKLDESNIKIEVLYNGPLHAPVKQGDEVGILKINIPNMPEKSFPLYASKDVSKMGLFKRIIKNLF
ncbi:D-alanyl-D-alanine carboxypeptidase [Rickettsiales bacterium]|nr:D-alanyl-D-alanine carboxypeptidase [Rickettsiales bacterium]